MHNRQGKVPFFAARVTLLEAHFAAAFLQPSRCIGTCGCEQYLMQSSTILFGNCSLKNSVRSTLVRNAPGLRVEVLLAVQL